MAVVVQSQVRITNETGGDIKFVKFHDYDGEVEPPYHEVVQISQPPAVFVHRGSNGCRSQSIDAVVYRCKNRAGEECDWMMSWLNIRGETRKVYTEIMEAHHYANDAVWQQILIRLNNGGLHGEAQWANLTAIVNVVPDGASNELGIFQGIIRAN